jgi:hypothetical protein
MPVTIYPTTRATFFDTKATAKGKWLQQIRSPSSARAGMIAEPPTTHLKFHDTKLVVLQKIITGLQ